VVEVASVSIGSVYQYFPDKRAIFVALHEGHIEQIEAMIDAHTPDPELYELLMTEVPHRAEGTREFAVRLHGAFRLANSSRTRELKPQCDPDKLVFIVTHMVDALSHGVVLRRPPSLSLADAKKKPFALSWLTCTRDMPAGDPVPGLGLLRDVSHACLAMSVNVSQLATPDLCEFSPGCVSIGR
jgi:AcrR family transcriptional regulator